MRCVVVNYGSGNIRSVTKALVHVAPKGYDVVLSEKPEDVRNADYVVLPGVGAFGNCYQALSAIPEMTSALCDHALERQRPFLGICVGMQMLAEHSTEHGSSPGLGWIDGKVRAFDRRACQGLAIPHIGWTSVTMKTAHPVLMGWQNPSVYFVHSFVFDTEDKDHTVAEAEYGETFCAIVGKDNLLGTQFHPEKSQRDGLRLLENFLHWKP